MLKLLEMVWRPEKYGFVLKGLLDILKCKVKCATDVVHLIEHLVLNHSNPLGLWILQSELKSKADTGVVGSNSSTAIKTERALLVTCGQQHK